ncbi:MAG: serine hydrolase [Verrucomicrobiota bacterium]
MNHSYCAESFVVVEAATGGILSKKNENTKRQVASLTKVATVLLALDWARAEQVDLETPFPVGEDAISGGVNPLNLREGDQISVRDAMFASMMASDNTSAYVLAEAIGSEVDPGLSGDDAVGLFVEMMNGMAKSLGMAQTEFVNPHGLDGETDLGASTAADMARLTMAAYRDPQFISFVSEKEYEVSFERGGEVHSVRLINTNELVGSRGVDGVKTGTTWRAGACLIASATRNDQRIIVVVLKAENRFQESVILLNRGWETWDNWSARGGGIETKERLRIDSK